MICTSRDGSNRPGRPQRVTSAHQKISLVKKRTLHWLKYTHTTHLLSKLFPRWLPHSVWRNPGAAASLNKQEEMYANAASVWGRFAAHQQATCVYSNEAQRAEREALTRCSAALPLGLYLLFQYGEQACLIAPIGISVSVCVCVSGWVDVCVR